jgi:hypothetical protein
MVSDLKTKLGFHLQRTSRVKVWLNVLICSGRDIVIPRRGSETFLSLIGLIEHRKNLYDGGITGNHLISSGVIDSTIKPGNRSYADLCVMASAVAYENKLVIRNRVTEHWKVPFNFHTF